jgi:hypothetical protein
MSYEIEKYSNMYADINHHPDMMYELKRWQEIKGEMKYPKEDNNKGYTYGVYWLDDDDEVCEVEWFKTEKERFEGVNETNNRLRNAFYDEPIEGVS